MLGFARATEKRSRKLLASAARKAAARLLKGWSTPPLRRSCMESLEERQLLSGNNYAVLFSGGINVSQNHWYYYDTLRNLYETLTSSYFDLPASNIFVIYADGTNPANDKVFDGGQTANSDMSFASGSTVLSATKQNLQSTLQNLASSVTSSDHFFFWSFDHGGGVTDPAVHSEEVLCGWGEDIRDDELAPWLDGISGAHNTSVHAQCYAGGMLEEQTIGSGDFGCSATNHYEGSRGDCFAGAFTEGLLNYRSTTYGAFEYALNNDLAAILGLEHPWSTGDDFSIFYSPMGTVSGGVLTIDGTDNADTISISQSGNDFTITYNSVTHIIADAQNITSVVVNGLDGSDVIDCSGISVAANISGGAGADSITGGSGNDVINGNGGADTIFGGSGADSISGGGNNDLITGDAGADTISGGTENDTIYGSGGNDSLLGDAGNDLLQGNGGSDTLAGGTESDTLDYSYITDGTAVSLTLGESTTSATVGVDTDSLSGFETVIGGSGNDTLDALSVTTFAVSINGGAGNDFLYGGSLGDTLSGGAGNDWIAGRAGADVLYGNDGTDSLRGSGGNDTLDGGNGNDTANYTDITSASEALSVTLGNSTGTASSTSIGNDTLTGFETVFGGAGNDTINASSVTLFAVRLEGYGGNDTLTGGNYVDAGSGPADTLMGGDGTDSLIGGSGRDSLDGGLGNDVLLGGNDQDTLSGGAGNDTLNGGQGWDTLLGGDNDDVLNGDRGNDSLNGEAGNDTADYTYITDMAESLTAVLGNTGGTAGSISTDQDTLAGIETVLGGAGTDTLDASAVTAFAVRLEGRGSGDTLKGGSGNDYLDGGQGWDSIVGGQGVDTLIGGDGNDVIDAVDSTPIQDVIDGGNHDDSLRGDSGDVLYSSIEYLL